MIGQVAGETGGAQGKLAGLALLAGHNQQLYLFRFWDVSDIADQVGSPHLESLSSADRAYHFWLTPTGRGHPALNALATKMFHAVGGLAVAETPLLSGRIVITSADSAGRPRGLADIEVDRLVTALEGLSGAEHWTLDRRIDRAHRRRVPG